MTLKRKAVRICPYRDSSCPYGDRCKYAHTDSKVYFLTGGNKRPRRIGNERDTLLSMNKNIYFHALSSAMIEHVNRVNPASYVITGSLARKIVTNNNSNNINSSSSSSVNQNPYHQGSNDGSTPNAFCETAVILSDDHQKLIKFLK